MINSSFEITPLVKIDFGSSDQWLPNPPIPSLWKVPFSFSFCDFHFLISCMGENRWYFASVPLLLSSRFLQIMYKDRFYFSSRLNMIPLCLLAYFFVYSSANGYSDYLHLLAVMNNATMKMKKRRCSLTLWLPFLCICSL